MRPLSDLVVFSQGVDFLPGVSGFAEGHRIVVAAGLTGGGNAGAILDPMIIVNGDANADCIVNVDDLLGVINAWGKTHSLADLNHDDIVNVDDLIIVLNQWTFR
jgi:hypothetical protein